MTRLSIDVYPKGRAVAAGHHHYSLQCAPARGTVPHPGTACASLARLQHPFAPTPPGTVCPMLVLGPQEAHVVGTVRGVRVNAWLNLVHCGVDRWNRVRAIVPEPYHAISLPGEPVPAPAPGGSTVTTGALPTVTGFNPSSGPVGTVVTVTGTNLDSAVGVQLGSVITVPAAGASATELEFTIPQGATTGPIKVFSKGGAATSAGIFSVTG